MSDFGRRKLNCLGKIDKSSAGRIDSHAVEICGAINEMPDFYTTSSCAGRTHLWRGVGYKGTTNFERFRVNHELIEDVSKYFDLQVSATEQERPGEEEAARGRDGEEGASDELMSPYQQPMDMDVEADGTLWLRCEPFILHVCCRNLRAARALVAASRTAFKNVGLQSWKDDKFMVCIWGDDGLDMPLTVPGTQGQQDLFPTLAQKEWLKTVVNGKHLRNWAKIDRLTAAVRELQHLDFSDDITAGVDKLPRHFDVIGDVALLHELPATCLTENDAKDLGKKVVATNRQIKICAVRCGELVGDEKRVDLKILAGHPRKPLMTTHYEMGVGYVINVGECFFSPRMGLERLRLCNSVGRDEEICCLFSGCAAEVLQIAVKTHAKRIVAIELNAVAVSCARKGIALLRGKTHQRAGNIDAASKIELIEGDVATVLPTLPLASFDRIIAPRPKGVEANVDGGGGDGGSLFLNLLLPLLKCRGECHWYDFASKAELPSCLRTTSFLEEACAKHGLACEILHVGLAGKKSIAARQYRVCVDFRVRPISAEAQRAHGKDVVDARMLAHTSKKQMFGLKRDANQ